MKSIRIVACLLALGSAALSPIVAADTLAVAPEYVGLFPNEMRAPALAWSHP